MHIYNGLTSRSEYGPILKRMQIRCSENGSIFKDFLRAITRRGGYTAGLRLIVQSSQIFSFVQVAQTRLTNRHGRPNIELCRDEPAHRSAHRQVMQPQVSTQSSHAATSQYTVKSCSHRSEHSQVMQPQVLGFHLLTQMVSLYFSDHLKFCVSKTSCWLYCTVNKEFGLKLKYVLRI